MRRLWIVACAVTVLASCNDKKQTEPFLPGKLSIEPIITKATEVNFEAGDKIGLTVSPEGAAENYADNACLTFASEVFTSDLEWYADVYTKADLYAYYPYDSEGAPKYYFQFEDQSAGIGAADFSVKSMRTMAEYNYAPGKRPEWNVLYLLAGILLPLGIAWLTDQIKTHIKKRTK